MAQYGVRMYSEDFRSMSWSEFSSLLVGLSPDTPLGTLIRIRGEDDPETLKRFTPAQNRIRSAWRDKHSNVNNDKEAHAQFLAQMQSFFMKEGGQK